MTEPVDTSGPEPAPPPADGRPPRRRWNWKLILGVVILTPILLFSLYTAVVLNWAYSEGDRSGVMYKLSRKGWICKTWEGELNLTPGAAAPTIWNFTIRDDAVAKQINEAMGKEVALHYTEHLGVPTNCFGETRYFVDGFRLVAR
jgi:hypothetical protein